MFTSLIKRRLASTLAVLGIVAVALMTIAQPANAYSLIGAKQDFIWGNTIDFQWGNLTDNNSTWTDMFLQAGYSWNNAQTKFQWGNVSSSSNIQQMYYVTNSNEYGRTQLQWSPAGIFTRAWMEVNQYSVSSKSWNFQKSVATHELGHGVGLGESSASPAVMNQARDREKIYTPQTDDVDGVNHIY